MPDAARTVEIAEKRGWFADEWTLTTRALAELVAGVSACGSINREGWAVKNARADVESALPEIGVGYR